MRYCRLHVLPLGLPILCLLVPKLAKDLVPGRQEFHWKRCHLRPRNQWLPVLRLFDLLCSVHMILQDSTTSYISPGCLVGRIAGRPHCSRCLQHRIYQKLDLCLSDDFRDWPGHSQSLRRQRCQEQALPPPQQPWQINQGFPDHLCVSMQLRICGHGTANS